jgi:hypothetical protein
MKRYFHVYNLTGGLDRWYRGVAFGLGKVSVSLRVRVYR